MKSKVDEKNLDEEISKVKDKLSSKIAERQKAQADSRRPEDDNDLFASPTGRVISGREFDDMTQSIRRQRGINNYDDDDLMEIDPRPRKAPTGASRKRTVRDASEDDDVEEIPAVAAKKQRTTVPTKPVPASRSRQSSVSSNHSSAQLQPRRTPLRAAASRAKKVPLTERMANNRLWKVTTRV